MSGPPESPRQIVCLSDSIQNSKSPRNGILPMTFLVVPFIHIGVNLILDTSFSELGNVPFLNILLFRVAI